MTHKPNTTKKNVNLYYAKLDTTLCYCEISDNAFWPNFLVLEGDLSSKFS